MIENSITYLYQKCLTLGEKEFRYAGNKYARNPNHLHFLYIMYIKWTLRKRLAKTKGFSEEEMDVSHNEHSQKKYLKTLPHKFDLDVNANFKARL